MANPNNLIRPPILGNQIQPQQAQVNPTMATPELRELIGNIVRQVVSNNNGEIIQNAIAANERPVIINDVTINEELRNDLSTLDKVPDIVRSLREFSGDPKEFSSWKKSVDRVLTVYGNIQGTPKYYGILNTIRNKVIGNADIVLESYNTPLNWLAISRCLTTHYADKRDLGTLEYQMTSLVQGRQTVQQFYQQVYSHLSLILNKISCMEMGNESMQVMTSNYRDKALDTFIRGLSGDLPRLLGIQPITDLPHALHLCLKLQNQSYRTQHAGMYHESNKGPQSYRPPLPPKHMNRANYQQQTFYPELSYLPQPKNHRQYQMPQPNFQTNIQPQPFNPNTQQRYALNPQQYSLNPQQYYQPQNNYPTRPIAPKPQPPPEPMDIDQSIRTQRIDYANKPTFRYAGKRTPNSNKNTMPPYKQQRSYNIEAQPYDENQEQNEYEPEQPTQLVDCTDIHFLE